MSLGRTGTTAQSGNDVLLISYGVSRSAGIVLPMVRAWSRALSITWCRTVEIGISFGLALCRACVNLAMMAQSDIKSYTDSIIGSA